MTCPACADVRASLAPGETVRCEHCPRPRRRPRLTGDLARDLAVVLADLDVLERWLARAGYGCGLRALQGAAGVGPGLAYQGDGSGLLARWDPEDAACQALLWRALEAAAEVLPGPERTRDPDWTRARELERRLRAVPGEAGRTLAWLVGRATPESALAEVAARAGWELASLGEREAWVEAGMVATQERVRRRRGAPRADVTAPRERRLGPAERGVERLREAVRAWLQPGQYDSA